MLNSLNVKVKDLFFLGAMILVSVLAFTIFQPYINIVIISIVIVQIFYPLYQALLKLTKSSGISTIVSIISVILLIIIPTVMLLILTISEVRNLAEGRDILGSLKDLETSINQTISNINNFFGGLNISITLSSLNLQELFISIANGARDQLLPVTQQILALSGNILFALFLLLLSLSYIFPIYDKLPEHFAKISPLDKRLDLLLFQKFRDTTRGVIKGTFFVAIVQATAVLIPLLFLNVGAPVLLWIIMVILSIIPIGSGLVWGPIGLAMIIEGVRTGNSSLVIVAIALIIYSAIIINVIDTTLRPRIMKNTVNIHPLVTIFSVLGGIYAFGPIGILYGPIIVVFFLSIIEIYNKQYLNESEKNS